MLFSRFKTTEFVGGGLVLPKVGRDMLATMGHAPYLAPGFTNPAYVDGRPYCIEASNQGPEPSCAGFTVAGYKEVRKWRETGIPVQYDGSACYAEAKRIDGMPKVEGTTLHAAATAAIRLGWLSDKNIRPVYNEREVRWALHQKGALICGVMIDENINRINKKTGYMASDPKASSLGGHAMLMCYYDKDGVGFQNSWGTDYGINGFFLMTWDQFRQGFHSAVVLDEVS